MTKRNMRKIASMALSTLLAAALACLALAGCASSEPKASESSSAAAEAPATRTVTDMANRTVEIPAEVDSIATFGSVGVLNAFVECMGKGEAIVNEMPANFTKNDKWAMQYKFAPQIKEGEVFETADGVDIEKTLTVNPDLCITMTEETAQQLEENGLACIVLKWNDVEDVKKAVTLMGEALNVPDRAKDYNDYFDQMVGKAESLTSGLAEADRVKTLYGDVMSLTNPHVISEWWIETAGGSSVTKEAHVKNSLEYTMEDLLGWQPEVIFSSNVKVGDILADANLQNIPAIQSGRVYAVPTVAHVWGNRTVEQPLTVMWAMSKLYPDLYSEAELAEDITYFYEHFFECPMTEDEVSGIINYGA
ncbi:MULTISPECIES: ABC transporter substrate-binding protein [unclassified Adlercreutzia]|uniref:ABC transporter substrate-binding protein n=1 Tax=unclassified Adlercreutzia TaxID=2636013 RepID=UPI0019823E3C|nr:MULTISPECIES: ABC transporter substrate-binding protein [unclassified Adlercreutzia]